MSYPKTIIGFDGEPFMVIHPCPDNEKGQTLSPIEEEAFAVKLLAAMYSRRSAVNVGIIEDRRDQNSPHLIVNLPYGVVNIVVCVGRPTITRFAELEEAYRERGIIPRIIVVHLRCIETSGGKNIKGGHYTAEVESIPVMLRSISVSDVTPRQTSVDEILRAMASGWESLDSSVFVPHLNPRMQYFSDFLFDPIPSADESIKYIDKRFSVFSKKHWPISTQIINDLTTGRTGILVKVNGDPSYVDITIKDGWITEMHTMSADVLKRPEHRIKISQTHRQHIEAIMPIDQFEADLPTWIKSSRTINTVDTHATLKHYSGATTVTASAVCEMPNIFTFVQAANPVTGVKEFITAFPVFFFGHTAPVLITHVYEWRSTLEATICCRIGTFRFAFYANDYFIYKDRYRPGRIITVNLTALALQAAISPDTITGPQYSQYDPATPDQAHFTATVRLSHTIRFMRRKFIRTLITIHPEQSGHKEVRLPLYIRRHMLPEDPLPGQTITGTLWIMGEIADYRCDTPQRIIARDLGELLPIYGGWGTYHDPIIIRADVRDYVAMEYRIIDCLYKRRGVEYEIESQALIEIDGRKVDEICILTKQHTPDGPFETRELIYIDIHSFLRPSP